MNIRARLPELRQPRRSALVSVVFPLASMSRTRSPKFGQRPRIATYPLP
jgi:hypothetical protein